MMKIQWQKAPNIVGYGADSQSPFSNGGEKMAKTGGEQWALLPDNDSDYISAGTYYIAVQNGQVADTDSPANLVVGNTLGSFNVNIQPHVQIVSIASPTALSGTYSVTVQFINGFVPTDEENTRPIVDIRCTPGSRQL
jgi:hypothetical protein